MSIRDVTPNAAQSSTRPHVLRRLFVGLGLMATLLCANAADPRLFLAPQRQAADPSVVRLDVEALRTAAAGQRFTIELPGHLSRTMVLERKERGLAGSEVWFGRVEGDAAPAPGKGWVILSMARDGVSGLVDLPDGRIELSGRRGALTATTPASPAERTFAPRVNDGAGPLRGAVRTRPADLNPPAYGGVATIDVAVASTPEFNAAHAVDGPLSRLNLLIGVANQSFLDSRIQIRLNLVRFQTQISPPTKPSKQTLIDMTPSPGNTLPIAQAMGAMREGSNADIAVLLRQFVPALSGDCGHGWIGGYRAASTQPPIDLEGESEWGYVVVHDGGSLDSEHCDDTTLAHEVGHNLGSMHDHDEDSGDERGAYDESFAHLGFSAHGGFVTMMGYTGYDHPHLLPVFSSPLSLCEGVACGVASGGEAADDVRRFSDVRFKVAGWRGARYNPLEVGIAGNGNGSVTADGLDCGALCRAQYPSTSSVELHAVRIGPSLFAGWTGDCRPVVDQPTTCVASMSQARKVTATFISKTPYVRLTLGFSGKGTGAVSGDGIDCSGPCTVRVLADTPLVLHAAPAVGKQFGGWSGACAGQPATCRLQLSEDTQVGVQFKGQRVVSMAAGGAFALAVLEDGSRWAWGDNHAGQLGLGYLSRGSSRPILAGAGFQTVEAGDTTGYGIQPGGRLFAWGQNGAGQIGDGTHLARLSPVPIADDVLALRAGSEHVLAARKDGRIWAWGRNVEGQFGDNSQNPSDSPRPVLDGHPEANGFSTFSAYANTSFGVKRDGTLWAWGENRGAELGDGTRITRLAPVKTGDGFASVTAGAGRSVAIRNDGVLFGWGNNNIEQLDNGQTGAPAADAWLVPRAMGSKYQRASVAAVLFGSAIRADARWEVWGRDLQDAQPPLPMRPPTIFAGDYRETRCGTAFCLGLRSDGSLWSIGRNSAGELGAGDRADHWTPVEVFGID